ncbi:MAG: hypothetical protein LBU27_00180 [Candidatus Peribacteria bacterium]|jgi:hypothetical protein|nr:hypothetical protein [Candidatus Peribacteria bacterium]
MVVNTDGSSTITTLPATLSSDVLQTSFTDLKVDLVDVKQSLSQQLTDQLNQLYTLMSQQAQQIASSCQGKGEEAVSASVDLKAQRATELQAQMQQLQAEMDSLYQ